MSSCLGPVLMPRKSSTNDVSFGAAATAGAGAGAPDGVRLASSSRSGTSSLPRNSLLVSNLSAPSRPASRPTHSKSIRLNVDALPSFRDVPVSERQALLFKKLGICCNIFDFNEPNRNVRDKEVKRQTLLELVDYINGSNTKLSESVYEDLVKMLSVNIFRALPASAGSPGTGGGTGPDADEEEPSLEPAWPHLQIVYELLLRFVISTDVDAKVAAKYIDEPFVLKLLELFDSEDPREREYLKTIVHRIYGKFMAHRASIRRAVNNIFYHFIYETEKHNGVAELLEILGSIINGFALPLKDEHKQFLMRALIPLHKPKGLAAYYQQVAYCVSQFVEKDPTLAELVIKGLLKFWPVTNSQKEVLFLNELEDILDSTGQEEFSRCMVPMFKQLAQSVSSQHFQVAERALFLWNNDHFVNLVKPNRQTILPILFPALEKNVTSHWSQPVHGLTMNVRKLFLDMDTGLFQQCQQQLSADEEKQKKDRERLANAWKNLDVLASGGTLPPPPPAADAAASPSSSSSLTSSLSSLWRR